MTKKGKRKQKENWHTKVRNALIKVAWILAVALLLLPLALWESCTIIHVYADTFWSSILIVTIVVVVWAWVKGWLRDDRWAALLFFAMLGFGGGFFICLFGRSAFLAVNYLFPRTDNYQQTAIVYKVKETGHGRYTSHNIGLNFDNGTAFVWDAGVEEFYRFRVGDTCRVTMFMGYFGCEVIEQVEIVGKVRGNHPLYLYELLPIKRSSEVE